MNQYYYYSVAVFFFFFLVPFFVISVRIMYCNRALIKHNDFKGLYYGSFHSFRGPTSDVIVSIVFVYEELYGIGRLFCKIRKI